ncbi:hypothetical protein MLQ83_22975, partial [Escherichia coli]|nr:hypothetical protein [Escherichia coli]
MNYPRLLSSMDNPFSQTCQQPAFMFFYLREFICLLCRNISVIQKSGSGFAPIFPDTCYHLTHYWLAAVDIPVASDNPV